MFTLHAQASQDFSTTSVYDLWLVLTLHIPNQKCVSISTPKLGQYKCQHLRLHCVMLTSTIFQIQQNTTPRSMKH